MSQPIILPSVLLPRRHAELISRPRLQEKLLDLLEYKLVLIIAQAGYGKTALLVDFAHKVDMPVCWYTIDQHDLEFQRFLAHFTSSLLRVFPGFAQQTRSYIDTQSTSSPDPDDAAIVIINELHQQISEHFVFILDDFHLVNDNIDITRFISRFVQSVGDHGHLLIASRCQPKLPDLEMMVAHSQVSGLAQEDFLFTPKEIQLLAAKKHQIHLTDAEAAELAEKTEGWITALMLTDPVMWQGKVDIHRKSPTTGISLALYWDLFLNKLPKPVQDFLLYTSHLNEYNAELCTAVLNGIAYPLEDTNWASLIEAVIQENVFVLTMGEDGAWLRYHALFQEYLQSQLEKLKPELKVRLLRRLVEVYESQQEWEKAHDACLRLGDLQTTLDLIERASPYMVRHARYDTLSRWLKDVPEEILKQHPCLISVKGTLATLGNNVQQGLELLNQAERALRAQGGKNDCLVRTLLRRSSAYQFLGDYQPALKDAQEAYRLAENDPGLAALKAQAMRASGTTLGSLGWPEQAIASLEDALALYQSLDDSPNVASLHKELGIAYRKAGRLEDAHAAYNAALSYWRNSGSLHRLADLYNNLGVMHHYAGDYEQAGMTLNEALRLSRQCNYARLEAFILASLGDILVDLEVPESALQAYDLASQVARRIKHRFLPLHMEIAKANLARSNGDYEEANRCIRSAERHIQIGGDYDRGQWMLARGCLALAQGNKSQAIKDLQEAIQAFSVSHLPFEVSWARLYLASACYQAGDEQNALTELRLAVEIAAQIDGSNTLVIPGKQHRPLLQFAIQTPECAGAAKHLIEQIDNFEHRLPGLRRALRRCCLEIPFVPPTLAIQAFGESQIELDGKVLTTADWKSQAQREFFYYLLAHPEGATRRTLERTFWADQENPRRQCENVIRRLRDAFGEQVIIFDAGRYKFNQALDYEYDVETFLKIISRAKAEKDPRRQADAYREAVALYRGHYLEDADGSWVIPFRTYLLHAWLDTLLHLAEFHLAQREHAATFDYCWRVLEREPHMEAAHRILMRSYAILGDRSGLTRQYQLCQSAMADYLQTTPSPETKTLYRSLLRD